MIVTIYLLLSKKLIEIKAQNHQDLLSIRNSIGKQHKIKHGTLKIGRFLFQEQENPKESTLDTIHCKDNQFIFFQIPEKCSINNLPKRNSSFGFGEEKKSFYQTYNDIQSLPSNFEPSNRRNERSQRSAPLQSSTLHHPPQEQLSSEERRLLNDFISRESSADHPISELLLIYLPL
jgi:hypothetical protein